MAGVSGRCPNCSAPIAFAWASSVQTVCAHCRSVVVRHDVDLAAVGAVSDPPVDSSPIQIGTTGRTSEGAFTVTGRIAYEYENGGWNEWHLSFADGTSGWLSDAMAEYAVSRAVEPPAPLPGPSQLDVGRTFGWGGETYRVTTRTLARYRAVDGELPFEYWDKDEVLFVDLRSASGAFGTIDCSQEPPLLFLGRFVEYDELQLANVRRFEGWPT
jgi:hypothetical protein